MRKNWQMAALLALAVLTAVFSVGFFAGRKTVPYALSAETERPVQESAQEQTQSAPEAEDDDSPSGPINLNTATLDDLMTLPRIGEKLAQRILDYRAQYGRFSAPEQLMDVDGIGEATFENLKDFVTVEDPE